MVHQSVHPIEIGIMDKQHQWEDRNEVYPSSLIYLFIQLCILRNIFIENKDDRNQSKNHNGDNGIKYFSEIIFFIGVSPLNFCSEKFVFIQYIKEQKSQSGNYTIASANG
jgi:hypothetical protein